MTLSRRDLLKYGTAAAASLLLPDLSFGYGAKAHSNLTDLAVKLYRRSDHHADFDNQDLVAQLIKGSVEEDSPVTNCAQHYYNPDRLEGQRGLIFPVLNDGSKDALTRAQALWQQTLDSYRQGKSAEAYHTLGRVCHLLEDMASPEHVYLVDHSIVNLVTKDNRLLDREFLQKLGQHLNLEEIDLTRSTLKSGSTYEKKCENLPLGELINLSKLNLVEKASLKEYFNGLAQESLNSEITPLLLKHLWLGPTGNGTYIDAQFQADETLTLAEYLVPRAVSLIAGLLKTWEKNIQPSASAPHEQSIVFFTLKEGIYTSDSQGKKIDLLVKNGWLPSWSPDGQKMAFLGSNGKNLNVWSQQQTREIAQGVVNFSWHPQSQQLLFYNCITSSNKSQEIYKVNLDGSGLERLTYFEKEDKNAEHPVWSPDGKRIIFFAYSRKAKQKQVIITDSQGKSLKTLDMSGQNFSWSPDSQKVVFGTDDHQLGIYDLVKDALVKPAEGRSPCWSPDGEKIAYEINPGFPYILDLKSGQNLKLAEKIRLTSRLSTAAWSKHQIVFAAVTFEDPAFPFRDSSDPEIFIVNDDGTHLKQLTNSRIEKMDPSFRYQQKN